MGYESEERTLEMMMTMEMRWSHSPLVVGTTPALPDDASSSVMMIEPISGF